MKTLEKRDWGVVTEDVERMMNLLEDRRVDLSQSDSDEMPVMVELMDGVRLSALEKSIRRGRCATIDDLIFFERATGGEGRRCDRYRADICQAVQDQVLRGKRLNNAQYEALRSVCPDAAEVYERVKLDRSQAQSSASRVAAFVRRRSDIGEIPDVVDPDRRERCRYDLRLFGVTYCMGPNGILKHEPSEEMDVFIHQMQETILHAGRVHVRWPRGKGKSTWVKIGMLWSVLYGHRRFPVAIGATGGNAESILTDIWELMEKSDELLEDFPEVCFPIRCLDGIMQRCDGQTYHGVRTEIKKMVDRIHLPKIEGSEASGATIYARGADSKLRGIVRGAQRPDFVFFDDIQDRKDSGSQAAVKRLTKFIQADALGLAGHDKRLAAFMASTPITFGDLSDVFADTNKHPEWITFTSPLIIQWPENLDLVADFGAEYRKDVASKDSEYTRSRRFYLENREDLERGAKMLDPLDGDPRLEYSSLHHALNLYFESGRESFMAEYQMQTRGDSDLVSIDTDLVCRRLNKYPMYVIPNECRRLVIFSDINARGEVGIRWTAMAVGPGLVTSVVGYGRYPEQGKRLYPLHCSKTEEDSAVASGILAVAGRVLNIPFKNAAGKRIYPSVLCFDGGWKTKVVSRVVQQIGSKHTKIIWSKGFGWKMYRATKRRDGESSMEIGDHTHVSVGGKYGDFLSYQADYWREIMQRSFIPQPLQRGSCTLFGEDPAAHYDFATEICAEKLIDRGLNYKNEETWEWAINGENHYGDCLTGCYILASHYRFYDAQSDDIDLAIRSKEMGFTVRDLRVNRERVYRKFTHNKSRFRIKQ